MSFRWVPNVQAVDCDLILATTGETLHTVQLPVVPRIGEELDLDLPHRSVESAVLRVVRVRYHVRPRRLTSRDDLFGVLLYVELAS